LQYVTSGFCHYCSKSGTKSDGNDTGHDLAFFIILLADGIAESVTGLEPSQARSNEQTYEYVLDGIGRSYGQEKITAVESFANKTDGEARTYISRREASENQGQWKCTTCQREFGKFARGPRTHSYECQYERVSDKNKN
jgi:hypothetical protein